MRIYKTSLLARHLSDKGSKIQITRNRLYMIPLKAETKEVCWDNTFSSWGGIMDTRANTLFKTRLFNSKMLRFICSGYRVRHHKGIYPIRTFKITRDSR